LPILANIGVVFMLILLNGFFAMSELAIVSARRARLKQMADYGRTGAALAMRLTEDPASFLSIVQTGMTLNSVLAGAFSGATLSEPLAAYLNTVRWLYPYGGPVAFAITVGSVTYFSLVIGELAPKRIGLAYAEPIAANVALAMIVLFWWMAPVIWFLKKSTALFLRLVGFGNLRVTTVTEEEVRHMIAEGADAGAIKPQEKAMLDRVMRLADRTVRTIMTPRLDMVWLGADDPPHEHKKAIRASGYSRFPVARGADLEEILGIVHAKDILNAQFDGQILALKTIMRPALIMQDTTPVLRLLDQFRQSGQHIAIVVDEYGSVEGLVSVTDILESVTGELPERGQQATRPVRREDGSWLIDGSTPIDEIETLIGLRNMRGDGDFHTLAGFVVDKLRRIPAAGDHFTWDDARFEVVDMDNRRVDKVLVYPPGGVAQ
jgi:putative hemolysin